MASDQALRDLILASNPVGYWPLDNIANLGLDASPKGNHGSQSGTFSQQIKTLFGMDMTMTKGVTSSAVTIPDLAEYRGNKLTIEMVVAGAADDNSVIFERGTALRNWSIMPINSTTNPSGVPGLSCFIGNIKNPEFSFGGALNLPAIVHVMFMMDGGKLQTVINGGIRTVSLVTGSGSQVDQNATPLKMFSRGGTYIPTCHLAHVAIYDRLLTSDEIQARANLLVGSMDTKNQPLTAIPANQETRAQFQPQDVTWRGGPGFVYSGPMPFLPNRPNQLCQPGPDQFWTRDGVQNVLQGYIESTVTISGQGVRRRVLCYTQSGELVGETWSRASDGKYRFDLLWLNRRYMLVAQDDPTFGPADYNAVAADYQQPTPYASGEGVGLTGA